MHADARRNSMYIGSVETIWMLMSITFRSTSVLLSFICMFYLFLYVLCAFCTFLCFCVHYVFWCVLCVWAKLPEIKLDDDDDDDVEYTENYKRRSFFELHKKVTHVK